MGFTLPKENLLNKPTCWNPEESIVVFGFKEWSADLSSLWACLRPDSQPGLWSREGEEETNIDHLKINFSVTVNVYGRNPQEHCIDCPDIHRTLIYIIPWFTSYPDIHRTLIYIIPWYTSYPHIYYNLIYIIPDIVLYGSLTIDKGKILISKHILIYIIHI